MDVRIANSGGGPNRGPRTVEVINR